MHEFMRLKRNGWVLMLCGIIMIVYKVLSGTFMNIWLQMKASTGAPTVLFALYILLEFVTAVICIYAGFLGFQRYGDVEEIKRSVTFSYIVIGLIVITEVFLAIALSGIDSDNIFTLLIYVMVVGFYIFNAKTMLKD